MARIILITLLAAWVGSPVMAGESHKWVSTQWLSVCTQATLDAGHPEQDCDEANPTGAAAAVTMQLEAVSDWLQALQFYGPDIETSDGGDDEKGSKSSGKKKYIVWLMDESEHQSWGFYNPAAQTLNVNNMFHFAMGVDQADLAKNAYHMGAPAHELFHGIQAAYEYPLDKAHAWITEGMANAVMLAWLRKQGVGITPKTRHYDLPLAEPKCARENDRTYYGCYATQQFWTWAGERFGSADTIGYLHALLQQDLGPNHGLQGIDLGLLQFEPGGLYVLYPEFIATQAAEDVYYGELDEVTLAYDANREVEQLAQATVQTVAASAHRVVVNMPAGEMAYLQIELPRNRKNLHLIVDDQLLNAGGRSSRNRFRVTLTGQAGPQTFLVRVANVAADTAATKAQDYELRMTLAPRANCTFQAKVTYPDGTVETQTGMAGLNDRHHTLWLHNKAANVSDQWTFGVDISSLTIGGAPGSVTADGIMSLNSPKGGPFQVRLDIDTNADPGDVAGWNDMTVRETLDSGLGYPNRLAMRRLTGSLVAAATRQGMTVQVEAEFDAGDEVYLCEGGLEAQQGAFKAMQRLMESM